MKEEDCASGSESCGTGTSNVKKSKNTGEKTYKASVQDVLHYIKSGKRPPPEIENLDKKTRRKRLHTLAAFARTFEYEALTDTLYHVPKSCKKAKTNRPRKMKVLFTRDEVERVLEDIHGRGTNGGHMGEKRTQDNISKRFYWRTITEDVRQWVATCPQCQMPKIKSMVPEPMPIYAQEPWKLVGIDLIGPFKETAEGFKYVLTGTCLFSKWVEAEPIKDKSAEGVFQGLMKWIHRWGLPLKILSDQGKKFNNKKLNDLVFEKFEVRHLVTSAYHPQANGQDERTNTTLKRHLSKMVNEQQKDWNLYVEEACWAIRSSYSESTKHTPFEVMIGRKPRFPSELQEEIDHVSINYTVPALNEVAEYVRNTQDKQSAVHAKVCIFS